MEGEGKGKKWDKKYLKDNGKEFLQRGGGSKIGKNREGQEE